jgi:hypothetical protein
VARILFICLLCALLPLLGLTIAQVFATQSDPDTLAALAAESETTLRMQGQRELEAHAAELSARLRSTSASVLQLASYAEEVLRTPEVYGNFHRKPASNSAPASQPPAGGQAPATGTSGALPPPDPGQAVDNTLYYVTGKDGALRKALDDGESAVYFQARSGLVPFSQYDMNRVFATATLDPLLKAIHKGDPLTASVYLITSDNLLRTYPYVDTAGWPASRDFTNLAMYAYSPKKASPGGVVWTGPYVSQISRQWVVACLRNVSIGGKQVAVAGVELALDQLADQSLAFSFGDGATCWIQGGDGTLLAAQPGGDAVLRVIPIANADLPSEKHPDAKIKTEANLAESGAKEITSVLSSLGSGAMQLTPVGADATDARYAGMAEVAGPDWKLGGLTAYPVVTALAGEQASRGKANAARLPWQLGLCGLAVMLAMLLGYFEARRISQPLTILTQRLRRNISTQSATPVAIADDGEIGSVAAACQELLDRAFGSRAGSDDAAQQ